MGLGKTFVGSEKLWELNAPYNLVICQKSKISDWIKHFKDYYSDDYQVIRYSQQPISTIPKDSILIVNYETAWRRPELLRLKNFTLMLDESSKIKNERSNQSKFILKLKPDNVILLSGTPTGGKYEELWSQLHLLGWNIKKKVFLNQYTIQEWDDVMGHFKIVGYQHTDRLIKKLHQYGAVFMKSNEVFDLPKQNEIYIKCKTTKDYKDFVKNHYSIMNDQEIVGDTAATGVTAAAVGKWMKKRKVKDEYLWPIADSLGDNRFKLAVFCYQNNLPTIMLELTSRYRNDDLSMVVGSQTEDMDSDEALEKLKVELSKPNPDIRIIEPRLIEMLETGIQMTLATFNIAKDYGVPIQKALIERSYQHARS